MRHPRARDQAQGRPGESQSHATSAQVFDVQVRGPAADGFEQGHHTLVGQVMQEERRHHQVEGAGREVGEGVALQPVDLDPRPPGPPLGEPERRRTEIQPRHLDRAPAASPPAGRVERGVAAAASDVQDPKGAATGGGGGDPVEGAANAESRTRQCMHTCERSQSLVVIPLVERGVVHQLRFQAASTEAGGPRGRDRGAVHGAEYSGAAASCLPGRTTANPADLVFDGRLSATCWTGPTRRLLRLPGHDVREDRIGGLVVRKARGVVKTALSWGTGWATAAGLLHPLARLLGEPGLLGRGPLQDMAMAGFIGLSGGAVFAAGLAVSEDHRRLDEVRLLSGTLWGAAAGFAGPAVIALLGGDFGAYLAFATETPLFLVTLTTLGAASGTAMTALAKQADRAILAPTPELQRLPESHTLR